jgi:hypothetical protein
MKLDSKYFDRIRVRPGGKTAAPEPETQVCAWADCVEPGTHKAPMGRDQEGAYYHFCVDHVRLYNKSYNYFSGLGDQDIQAYLKASLTGNRPTWKMGSNSSGAMPSSAPSGKPRRWSKHTRDTYNLFEGEGGDKRPERAPRKARSLELKALQTLDLPDNAGGETIRVRYKALVKQYHPDANGGDRGSEDRLREVIQAYKLLRQSGFC